MRWFIAAMFAWILIVSIGVGTATTKEKTQLERIQQLEHKVEQLENERFDHGYTAKDLDRGEQSQQWLLELKRDIKDIKARLKVLER